MHREGHLIEEIVELHNLADSFDKVLRGRERKRSRAGRYLIHNREKVLQNTAEEIKAGVFKPGKFYEREIVENGKHRTLQIVSMGKRIGVNAIMTVVDKHLRKRYIRTSGASITKRGTHDLMEYIRRDLQIDPDGTKYAYKWDIRHFYENVPQRYAEECFRNVFKDEKLISNLDNLTEMLDSGVSFGLRSSQSTGNLVLSECLDHHLKDRMGVRYYYRYCDDGLVLASNKEELWKIRDEVHKRCESIGLEVKPDERIFPVTEGIDFLGYKIYPDHVMLRKRIKKRFAKRIGRVKSRRRRRELIASFYGMTKHADCSNLFKKLTKKNMKSFNELGIQYQPNDGKKHFKGNTIPIRELVNMTVTVKDFEVGVKTIQGEDRCIVSIDVNGEQKKFFTASKELENILLQARQIPDGFPFQTTIKAEKFGINKTKYIFT